MDQALPVLHVIVVGFHHKKGCQVEYAYPPFVMNTTDQSMDCPAGWKYLPTLALPDGSHKYAQDTVYFHLPSLHDAKQTIFGISCYRQISVNKLKNRTSDLTRETVQKSVCVLSTVPLFGHIQVKMALITHAYFEEGDFTKVSLLKDTYTHLNSCLSGIENLNMSPQVFVGLSARDFITKFRHKAVLLFKLLLLEKKLIFYCTPVHTLCSTILSLLSLYPEMLENGLNLSACVSPSRPMSPLPHFPKVKGCLNIKEKESINLKNSSDNGRSHDKDHKQVNVVFTKCAAGFNDNESSVTEAHNNMCYDVTIHTTTNLTIISKVDSASFGLPLPLFTEGYLCMPYLSLPYMDVLSDVNVKGYVIGATNILFKQKKQLSDVLIHVDEARIDVDDLQLRRLLHLTTEDLRFADYLVKNVCEHKENMLSDGVGWVGGEEWIRTQFKVYLISLLRTSLLPINSREVEHFNSSYVAALKNTNSYNIWASSVNEVIYDIAPCHPFAGQLSVADMKLRISHTIHSTEGGRRLNQAVQNTGRAVGGAFSQARGAFSNWWSNLTTVTEASSPSSPNQDRAPPPQYQERVI